MSKSRTSRRGSPTSVDVARAAGVSQSAVSRTFSPNPATGVSAATRAKVLAAAEQLGYRPNAIARTLITQRSRMVGVLFSYLDNQFYSSALEMLCHALQAKGYHALVFMMPDTVKDVQATVADILQYQVDGLITASVELSSSLCEVCHGQGIPVVMLNRLQDDPRLSSVTSDNVGGARLAASLLVRSGHRRIAMIAGWEGASTSRDREFGFSAELKAQGRRLYRRAVGHFHPERAREAARELFAGPAGERPDAVFVANDFMAVPVMDTLRHELGLRVPDDVAVIGFDDIAMAALPTYDLTTVRQPLGQRIGAAVRILLDRIAGRAAEPEHIILRGELIERGTTRRLVPLAAGAVATAGRLGLP